MKDLSQADQLVSEHPVPSWVGVVGSRTTEVGQLEFWGKVSVFLC